jgi:hypothetical protein
VRFRNTDDGGRCVTPEAFLECERIGHVLTSLQRAGRDGKARYIAIAITKLQPVGSLLAMTKYNSVPNKSASYSIESFRRYNII